MLCLERLSFVDDDDDDGHNSDSATGAVGWLGSGERLFVGGKA